AGIGVAAGRWCTSGQRLAASGAARACCFAADLSAPVAASTAGNNCDADCALALQADGQLADDPGGRALETRARARVFRRFSKRNQAAATSRRLAKDTAGAAEPHQFRRSDGPLASKAAERAGVVGTAIEKGGSGLVTNVGQEAVAESQTHQRVN